MKKNKIYIFYYFLGELFLAFPRCPSWTYKITSCLIAKFWFLFLCKIPDTFKFPNFFWNMKISCVHDVFDSFSQNDKITMYLLSFGMIIYSQTGKPYIKDINLCTLQKLSRQNFTRFSTNDSSCQRNQSIKQDLNCNPTVVFSLITSLFDTLAANWTIQSGYRYAFYIIIHLFYTIFANESDPHKSKITAFFRGKNGWETVKLPLKYI